jgi:hypothetical protein
MQITTIGLDIAKNVFQVHGIDAVRSICASSPCRKRSIVTTQELSTLGDDRVAYLRDRLSLRPPSLQGNVACWHETDLPGRSDDVR